MSRKVAACTSAEFEAYNPLRAPDWRRERARLFVSEGRRPSPRRDGAETTTLVRYLRDRGRRRPGPNPRLRGPLWSALREAERLLEQGGPVRSELEARLLAGQRDEEIAARLALDPGAVAWYEAAFFNVRDRLAARDWVVTCAIGAGLLVGACDLGMVWKAVAYAGGALALDAMIAATSGGADGPGDAPGDGAATPADPVHEGARLLAAVLMLPPETAPECLLGLSLAVRRPESIPRPRSVPELVAGQAGRALDEALLAPAPIAPATGPVGAVA